MSKALYRKYRSKTLDEIVGQKHVTDVLSRTLKQGKVAHAYLLTGPKGVGKTSIARILAHEINGLPYTDDSAHLDIIEIDAASNNGVDDVRDLREKVQIAPVSAAKKIYIIDEVHMLSKPAFNALLKTLEEPPEHVIFILATTNAEKLPETIISRTQRFGLRAMAKEDGMKHLKMIAAKEGIKIDDSALEIIAERGDGSFRNSVSLLDQLSSLADDKQGISLELIESILGLAPHALVTELIQAATTHDTQTIVRLLKQATDDGIQAKVLIDQLVSHLTNELANSPQLVGLLDGLLDAHSSSKPDVKLLTVLLSYAASKPKTAALHATAPVVSAPVKELAKPAASHPNDGFDKKDSKQQAEERVTRGGAAPTESSAKARASVGADRAAGPVSAKSYVQNGEQEKTTENTAQTTPSTPANPEAFAWDTLVEHVRTNHVALYSVLSKCSFELDGETLKLYTMRKFNKTKLDDAKYRLLLLESIVAIGAGDLQVDTIPAPPPPKDSQAAAVAAIMGGGEEVTL